MYNINDQTIANYCSDTVRELNNLTEELQSNLDVNRSDADRQNKKKIHDSGGESTSYVNHTANLHPSNSHASANHVAESSPFFTQLSQTLETNLNNLTLSNDQQNGRDSVDGGSVVGDIDGNAMLLSVDLNGKFAENEPMKEVIDCCFPNRHNRMRLINESIIWHAVILARQCGN